MNGPGNQFLAGAGFAGDQNVGVGRRNLPDAAHHLANGIAVADDLVKVVLGAQLFLQVRILHFQPVLELLHFLQGLAQFLFCCQAGGNVPEYHHRAHCVAIVHDRGAGVFHREAGAVLAPEPVVADPVHGAIVERRVDRAFP